MRVRRLKQAGWAGLCALIVAGCANTNPSSSPAQVTTATTLVAKPVVTSNPGAAAAVRSPNEGADKVPDGGSSFDNLDIVDAGLNGKVAILRVGSELAENNLLTVFAGLKNNTAHRLTVEVETIYTDQAGNALNAGSWIPVTLKPNEDKDYRSSAISEQAVDFLIRVRRAPTAPRSPETQD